MQTYRIKLYLSSGFITPWHADTIFGHLCWAAERHGAFDNFTGASGLIDLYRGGTPPLILSDAFPAGFLPAPANLKEFFGRRSGDKLDVDSYSFLKRVKSTEYITMEQFRSYQCGELFDLVEQEGQVVSSVTLHNQINRLTGTTGDKGSLFELDERFVKGDRLNIYARIEEDFEDDVKRLFEFFAAGGFGKKKSTGKGSFQLEEFEKFDELDVVDTPNGFVTLSHFVSSTHDPVDGAYKTVVKYGKLGEEKALCGNPFKKPLLMFKPGAVFRTEAFKQFAGRLIENIAYADDSVVQYGYALTAPVQIIGK